MKNKIDNLLNYDTLCNQINKVKDFLLFKKIFENAVDKDQSERFDDGVNKLNNLKKLFDKNASNI